MDPLKSLAPGVKRLDPTKSGFVAPEGKKTAQSGRVVTQGWKRPKGKGGKGTFNAFCSGVRHCGELLLD